MYYESNVQYNFSHLAISEFCYQASHLSDFVNTNTQISTFSFEKSHVRRRSWTRSNVLSVSRIKYSRCVIVKVLSESWNQVSSTEFRSCILSTINFVNSSRLITPDIPNIATTLKKNLIKFKKNNNTKASILPLLINKFHRRLRQEIPVRHLQ